MSKMKKSNLADHELALYEKFGESTIFNKISQDERNYETHTPIKLWLYYLDGKHIGTYNRTNKTAIIF